MGIGYKHKGRRKSSSGAANIATSDGLAVGDGSGGRVADGEDDSAHQPLPLRRSPPRKAKDVIKNLKRVVVRRDNRISKSKEDISLLVQNSKAAANRGKKMKAVVKSAEHNAYVERKTSRTTMKQLQEIHNRAMKEKDNKHNKEMLELKKQIEEARELVAEERRKAEQSEQARIDDRAKLKAEVRSERLMRSEALTRLKKEMNEILEAAQEASANDQAGMDAVLAHQKSVAQKRIDAIFAMSEREASVLQSQLAQKLSDEEALARELSEMRKSRNEARTGKRKAEAAATTAKSASVRKSSRLAVETESRKKAEDEATELGKKLAVVSREGDTSATIQILSHKQKRQLKKVRANAGNGKPGGGMVYPQWVMTTICELLACGAAPSAIGKILKATYRVFYDEVPEDIPSINYIRRGRSVLAVFNETMSAMKLAIAESWDQLCTDATTRRQIPFTALIIGLLGDDSLEQVIVSSCILTDDETADAQAEGIIKKVRLCGSVRLAFLSICFSNLTIFCTIIQLESLKIRLIRLAEVLETLHPGLSDKLVPSPMGIDLNKLKKGGVITTDTCNTAQKVRRVLVQTIKDVTGEDGDIFEFDCMNHLRNVWFGGMEKALTKQLNTILRTSLDEIDPQLRVTASLSAIIRAVDKEFSLSANYPKGHGLLFLEWIREYYPGVFLFHVERAAGSRQDLCTEGSMAVFWNYPYYIEFLDMMLRKPLRNKNQEASILQQSLFVALSSEEMIAIARLCSIMHISVCMPFRWLAGKAHELARYNFGPMNMAQAIQILYTKMVELSKNKALILDETFMMDIFADYRTGNDALPPFVEYWTYIFSDKKTSIVARRSGTKEVPIFCLRRECFHPIRKTVKKSSTRLKDLAKTAALAIIAELLHKNKATRKYLWSDDIDRQLKPPSKGKKKTKKKPETPSPYAWKHCTQQMKDAMLGKAATNDVAESTLGSTTRQIEDYPTIHFSGAAAVSDTRRNNHFNTYHESDERLKEALFLVCIEDADYNREQVNKALESQSTARHEREKLIMDVANAKATEKYLENMTYYRMYDTPSCWRGSPDVVTTELQQLKSDASKLQALKENITIRVKGFNMEWARHAWSKDGHIYTIDELAAHLKFIISKENEEELPPPPDINAYQLERKKLPILGKQVSEIAALDKKQMVAVNKFGERADIIHREREVSREGAISIYRKLQPWERPEVNDLLGKRIEMVYNIATSDKEEKKVLRWCQGEVVEVINAKRVCIIWDPIAALEEFQDFTESDEELLPKLWNSANTVEGAWRIDFDILLDEGVVSDGEVSIMDTNIDDGGDNMS